MKRLATGQFVNKDIKRQEEIQKYFPNFEFKRIRERRIQP